MIRLDKFLADAGIGTRSEVKKQIRSKRVTVNSQPAEGPEQKVDPKADCICVDGNTVCIETEFYYLLYKQAGCVTARTDAFSPTVMDIFPDEVKKKASPVGRLDKDTEGLLLITSDGELNHRLTSPAYHLDKTYYARLDTPVPPEAVAFFAAGIDIGDDKPTLPARLTILPVEGDEKTPVYAAQLTIVEGRYHQVKRMFSAVGCKVIYLKRLSMGPLCLGDLPKGEYRKLTAEEIKQLKESKRIKR